MVSALRASLQSEDPEVRTGALKLLAVGSYPAFKTLDGEILANPADNNLFQHGLEVEEAGMSLQNVRERTTKIRKIGLILRGLDVPEEEYGWLVEAIMGHLFSKHLYNSVQIPPMLTIYKFQANSRSTSDRFTLTPSRYYASLAKGTQSCCGRLLYEKSSQSMQAILPTSRLSSPLRGRRLMIRRTNRLLAAWPLKNLSSVPTRQDCIARQIVSSKLKRLTRPTSRLSMYVSLSLSRPCPIQSVLTSVWVYRSKYMMEGSTWSTTRLKYFHSWRNCRSWLKDTAAKLSPSL